MTHHDLTLIERLSGIMADSAATNAAARAFRARPEARVGAEQSYRLLLHPQTPGAVSLVERRAVAAFVAVLHGEERSRAHFLDLLRQTGADGARLAPLVAVEAEAASQIGRYGRFPAGPVTLGDLDGPAYRVDPALRPAFGGRLAAALEQAHLLALHPADDGPQAQAALRRAGWNAAGIATLAQLVAFLGVQVRLVAALRGHAAASAPPAG